MSKTMTGRRPFLKCAFAAAASTALAGHAPLFASDAVVTGSRFRSWAQRPPMGWNSWDCFATTITEVQTKEQADYMAAHLRSFGWEYLVVDIQWYEPEARGHDYRQNAVLTMDGYGRLLPALNRFPSAANGAGFTPLAAYVHSRGLKFGIHLMRGIPRQAVEKNLPVFGTQLRAQDIANRASICPWNPDMYGVDMTRPGAQAYYDSVFAQFAAWGVDYVKVDDISRPYLEHAAEIEAVRQAIDKTGRPMVLSLSPGETALEAAAHVREHANLWRISDDFWDRWLSLKEQFGRLERWNPHRAPGVWPDADMLPLGVLVMGSRSTRFTPDEQRTLMSLWCIARSPLMHGGDMTKTDPATLALLTNTDVLAVNQRSQDNRPLFDRDDLVAWTAAAEDGPARYLAVFNARDRVRLTPDHARFASSPVAAGQSVAVDADLAGARRVYLVADSTDSRLPAARVSWETPRFVMHDGSERPVTDQPWRYADALWDSTRIRKDATGHATGIGAQTSAVVEYDVPAGAARLVCSARVERPRSGESSPAQFLIVPATAANEDLGPGVAVPVALADVGCPNGATIKDLWTGRELGTVRGTFSPVVPFHGAGLYRLSPLSGSGLI